MPHAFPSFPNCHTFFAFFYLKIISYTQNEIEEGKRLAFDSLINKNVA
jgi:hypothetical protein